MPTKYQVTVRAPNEQFVAYTEDDLESAIGHAEFCRASMPGAMVSIDQINWELEEEEGDGDSSKL